MVAASSTIAAGKVARCASGASCMPTMPDAVIISTMTDWNRACAVASSRTLRFSGVIAVQSCIGMEK